MTRTLWTLFGAAMLIAAAQPSRRPAPPSSGDIDSIARLLQLEDTRTFDSVALARGLDATHPEVRRRAALAVGHIRDRRGAALLRSRRLDRDTALAATTVFAVAQL